MPWMIVTMISGSACTFADEILIKYNLCALLGGSMD